MWEISPLLENMIWGQLVNYELPVRRKAVPEGKNQLCYTSPCWFPLPRRPPGLLLSLKMLFPCSIFPSSFKLWFLICTLFVFFPTKGFPMSTLIHVCNQSSELLAPQKEALLESRSLFFISSQPCSFEQQMKSVCVIQHRDVPVRIVADQSPEPRKGPAVFPWPSLSLILATRNITPAHALVQA